MHRVRRGEGSPKMRTRQRIPALPSHLNFHTCFPDRLVSRHVGKECKTTSGAHQGGRKPGEHWLPPHAGAAHRLRMQDAEARAAGNNPRLPEWRMDCEWSPRGSQTGFRTIPPESGLHGTKAHCPVAGTRLLPACSEPGPVLSTLHVRFITQFLPQPRTGTRYRHRDRLAHRGLAAHADS